MGSDADRQLTACRSPEPDSPMSAPLDGRPSPRSVADWRTNGRYACTVLAQKEAAHKAKTLARLTGQQCRDDVGANSRPLRSVSKAT